MPVDGGGGGFAEATAGADAEPEAAGVAATVGGGAAEVEPWAFGALVAPLVFGAAESFAGVADVAESEAASPQATSASASETEKTVRTFMARALTPPLSDFNGPR